MGSIRYVALFLLVSACFVSCRDGARSKVEDSGVDAAVVAGGDSDTGSLGSCEGVACWEPPANVCSEVGGGAMTLFSPGGYCTGGECFYASKETVCPSGLCEAGVCQEQPCHAVVCNHPPDKTCASEVSTKRYVERGYCVEGACEYAWREDSCGDGLCIDGVCGTAMCHGVYCDKPEARFC